MASTPRKKSTSEPDLETETLSEFDGFAISEETKIEDRCVNRSVHLISFISNDLF